MQKEELIIIGAGPAGISLGVEAVNAGISPNKILIIEKSREHSFTIRKYYPESKIVTANFKGFTPVCTGTMCLTDSSKSETISYLDSAIKENRLRVYYNEAVYKIEKNKEEFKIFTNKNIYLSRVVAIAVGILGKPNKPSYKLPASIKEFLLFDITSQKIENSKVLVIGGGDSASEYTQFLSQENNRVTLSYRGNEFKRMNRINRQSLEALAEQGKIRILFNSNVEGIEDKGGKPFVKFQEDNINDESYDFVIFALGGTTPKNFLKKIGIEFNGPVPFLKEGYETNIPGMFLLGDLTAGAKGGSIIWAFNSADTAMKKICENYLECKI